MKIYYNGQGKTLNQHFATNLELLNQDGAYNYVAYLMADENGNSIKFAKYDGTTRVSLQHTWDPSALREAVLNAFVHNNYSTEIPPKFEIFDDRIEITSAGSLPEGYTEDEFFEGISAPRNKELMRIYRDLELVEQLGSGVPRILEHYDRSCFKFFPNFIRMIFPKMIGGQVGVHIRYIVNFSQCPIKFTI